MTVMCVVPRSSTNPNLNKYGRAGYFPVAHSLYCREEILFVLFELEDLLDLFLEGAGNSEGKQGRWNKLAAFDGVDRLAAYADPFGQLLLGHAQDGPFDSDVILHGLRCDSDDRD